MATSTCSLGLLADRTPLITPARNAAGPPLWNEAGPWRRRPEPPTHAVSNCLPNAPAKLRRANTASKYAWASRAPSASAGC